MKYKLIAFLLALTVMSWAQTTTPAPAAEQKTEKTPDVKSDCACCDKMSSAEHKDGQSCMRHKGSAKDMKDGCSGKDAASCCSGKEAKACMKGDTTADCCAKGRCGDGKEMNGCFDKKGEEKAENCCEGGKCGRAGHSHDAG